MNGNFDYIKFNIKKERGWPKYSYLRIFAMYINFYTNMIDMMLVNILQKVIDKMIDKMIDQVLD